MTTFSRPFRRNDRGSNRFSNARLVSHRPVVEVVAGLMAAMGISALAVAGILSCRSGQCW